MATIQIGKYTVDEESGIPGGMGVVYKTTDPVLDMPVAIKVLHKHLADQPGFKERFLREAKTLAKLKHPGIVTIYGADWHDGRLYMVMEWVEGDSLEHRLNVRGRMAPGEAVGIVAEVCEALNYAHRQGVVHRDIKPANIMLHPDGRVLVMDFGIAKVEGSGTLTAESSSIGTPHYMSPEQCEGKKDIGPTSDIYSLGIVLYEMLTGLVPFDGDSLVSIALKHLNEAPPPPSAANADIAPALESVIMQALHKDPAGRFHSAKAFADALKASLDGIVVPTIKETVYHPIDVRVPDRQDDAASDNKGTREETIRKLVPKIAIAVVTVAAVVFIAVALSGGGGGSVNGSISINNNAVETDKPQVTVSLNAGSAEKVRLAENEAALNSAKWLDCYTTKQFTLTGTDGKKTVFCQFKNGSGTVSPAASDDIELNQAGPWVTEGERKYEQKDYAGAEQCFGKALGYNPQSFDALIDMTALCFTVGRRSEAKIYLDSAARVNSGHPQVKKYRDLLAGQ